MGDCHNERVFTLESHVSEVSKVIRLHTKLALALTVPQLHPEAATWQLTRVQLLLLGILSTRLTGPRLEHLIQQTIDNVLLT